MTKVLRAILVLLILAVGAACGDSGGSGAGDGAAPPSDGTGSEAAACDPAKLPLTTDGKLTVATGEPVFPPWMLNDKPTNKKGFESALVYKIADQLGFAAGDVKWKRTGFDQAIAPGKKPYDFNIQQYSITKRREKVVDFSRGYYEVEQALVAAKDSPVAGAKSLADLKSARLGAAIGTTSLDYAEAVIAPDQQVQVYDDNAAAKAAFNAGQVDGLVFDLPTAYYITAVEIPKASIVVVLPRVGGGSEELGLLFAKGSKLRPCVDEALATLHDDGTIDKLEDKWLNQGGDIPTISE